MLEPPLELLELGQRELALFWRLEELAVLLQVRVQTSVPIWEQERPFWVLQELIGKLVVSK